MVSQGTGTGVSENEGADAAAKNDVRMNRSENALPNHIQMIIMVNPTRLFVFLEARFYDGINRCAHANFKARGSTSSIRSDSHRLGSLPNPWHH